MASLKDKHPRYACKGIWLATTTLVSPRSSVLYQSRVVL